jgi:trigger factor
MAEEQKTTVSKNVVTIEEAGPCKKKVCVEIPEETVKSATDEQYETLRKDAMVPGFRRGRAPRRLLEKRFGKDVSEQIKLKLLADASESAMKDNKIDALREPKIEFEKIQLPETGALKFEFEVEVRPEFALPALEGIPVNKTKLEVADEQINDEIEQLQEWAGVWAPREEGGVEAEDQVIADAVLKVEGVEEEEKFDNIEVYAKENGFVGAVPVHKLDEILDGAKTGETRETVVEVPKTYFKEEYRGKKVTVRITIKEIKWLRPAPLDGEFFKKYGVANEGELRERVRDVLVGRLEQQSRDLMNGQIYKYMLDNTNFDLPLNIVADQVETLLQRQYVNLRMRGLTHEQLAVHIEQLKAGSEEQAKEQLKLFFIMDKVAEQLGISVSEEELNGYIAQAAIQRRQRPERMREEMERDGSLGQFKLQVRENKCVAKMLETAKITEVEAEKPVKNGSTGSPRRAKKKVVKPAKIEEKSEKKVKKAAEKSDSDKEKEKKEEKKSKKATKPAKKKTGK